MVSLFPLIIFFTSFSIYLFTAFPSIYWRDASEFQAIGYLLDIAHPAGSPLYAMIAKWVTFIPLGSIAFKVTLLSVIFGASLSVIFYWIMQSVLQMLFRDARPSLSSVYIDRISFVSTVFFLCSNAVWENANRAEVYTFQNFFTAIFILLLLKLPPFVSKTDPLNPNAEKIIYGLFFLFGISLGAHAILILYLPLLLVWVYFFCLKPKQSWISSDVSRQVLLTFFFFLIAFSVYLYLPIRSVQNPHYDWGNPETFTNLIFHVSDRKDANFHFSVPRGNIFSKLLLIYWDLYRENFSLLGIVLGILGAGYLFLKKRHALLVLLGLFFFPPFIFFIRYWTENSAYIPTFIVLAILLGVGIGVSILFCLKSFTGRPQKKWYLGFVSLVLVFQLVMLFSDHFKQNRKQVDYWQTTKIMSGILDRFKPGAVVISYHAWFGLSYLQQVEGKRPDVTILSLSSFIVPDLFTEFEASRFQNIVIPSVSTKDFGSAFLTENVHIRPIYWEPVVDYNKFVNPYLVPEGLFYRINPVEYQLNDESIQRYFSNLSDHLPFNEISNDLEEISFYAQILSGHGAYFLEKEVYEIALGHFKMAVEMVPNSTHFLNLLGITYAYMKDYQNAEQIFLRSISMNQENYQPYLNLAKMFVNNAEMEKAEYYFNKVILFFPNHRDALFFLGKVNAGRGNKVQALQFFQRVLEHNSNDEDVKKEIDLLSFDS
ncbi:hypothetical protein MNBD_NITROSPIRAE01-836 [hydrothermal vent metagenome]|uniref:Uncharacterized protein n=1 Tax=hydrothermal vent metagenome TaxID=652676 RepID=A0A3B1C9M2_9ZZZZ